MPRLTLATLFVCTLVLSSAHAQSTFGSIRGTVTDVTGAVIAGASISAQSLDDGAERKTTSADSGEFILENL